VHLHKLPRLHTLQLVVPSHHASLTQRWRPGDEGIEELAQGVEAMLLAGAGHKVGLFVDGGGKGGQGE
jgi:hypothetical protein